MEADWEMEIGGGAPIIDAAWPGFVDLRIAPDRVAEIEETRAMPTLADALVRLNHATSPVWTAKCDVWRVEEPVDLNELDATPENATHGIACYLACYVDLLPRSDQQWQSPPQAAAACKALCLGLKALPLRACRADLIVRQAHIAPDTDGLGITAYLTACGADEEAARMQLARALAALADTLVAAPSPASAAPPLQ
jgi:hypothetical protein